MSRFLRNFPTFLKEISKEFCNLGGSSYTCLIAMVVMYLYRKEIFGYTLENS
jgi:hypothetical protein